LIQHLSSASLQELNSYRSGLLHKKGIADLQPHAYVKKNPRDAPFISLFEVLHEGHSKNTACLLACLAILTDEIVRLQGRPSGSELEFMTEIFESRTLRSFIVDFIGPTMNVESNGD
jgi:hypothetical protein